MERPSSQEPTSAPQRAPTERKALPFIGPNLFASGGAYFRVEPRFQKKNKQLRFARRVGHGNGAHVTWKNRSVIGPVH